MHRVLKSLYVFIILPIFLLCGCQKTSDASQSLKTDFSADFCAEYRQIQIVGSICTNRQGIVSICISKPETLDGLSINYKNGELWLRRDSMICSADEAYLPSDSFPDLLKNLLDGIADGRATVSTKNGSVVCYNLKIGNEVCIITADKNGKMIDADISGKEFYIKFSNLELLAN